MNKGCIPDDNYGYVPDEFVPEDVTACNLMTQKYDPTGQPAIVSWDSFESSVQQQAADMDKIRAAGWIVLWWVIAVRNLVPIWNSNQGQLGSCAGWSVHCGQSLRTPCVNCGNCVMKMCRLTNASIVWQSEGK